MRPFPLRRATTVARLESSARISAELPSRSNTPLMKSAAQRYRPTPTGRRPHPTAASPVGSVCSGHAVALERRKPSLTADRPKGTALDAYRERQTLPIFRAPSLSTIRNIMSNDRPIFLTVVAA